MEKNTEIFQYTTDDFHSDGNDILVLGIGNYLMGDEGIGVQFIQNLDTAKFPQNISFLDGGTGGFTLIPYIESHQKVIIVDATMDGKEEGTITLLKPKFSDDFPISLSGHNFGLKDMVDILSFMNKMPDIYLISGHLLGASRGNRKSPEGRSPSSSRQVHRLGMTPLVHYP